MTQANKNYLGVGLIGLGILSFWIFGMPSWDRISLLNDAMAEREDILLSREEVLKKIEDMNRQYQERSDDVDRIASVVPGNKSSAELVSTIESITQQSGLQLTGLSIGGATNEQQELQTAFVELNLSGTYPSLTVFLDFVEKNIRLLDVLEISISQTGTPGGQVSLNFRITMNAYYLNVK